MKKVLITGGTGFIGRHCIPLLVARDYEVHALSSRTSGVEERNVHWHRADLFEKGQVFDVLARVKPTHLIHTAWCVTPGSYQNSPANIEWVKASLDLVQAFARQGGRRLVITGSCAEYDWRFGYCSESLTPIVPRDLYGTAKHSLQLMVSAYSANVGLSAAWARIFFLYGPHEHPKRIVPSVVRSLLSGSPARCSEGDQNRDYLYVGDVADALVTLLDSKIQGPLNIGSGSPVSIKEIAYTIGHKLKRSDLIELGALPLSPDDPPLVVANTSRLKEALGWEPTYGLNRGIDLTIEWWRDNMFRSSSAVVKETTEFESVKMEGRSSKGKER